MALALKKKPTDTAALLEEARNLLDNVRALRRSIHREPELGLDLPLTQAKVLEAIRDLPLEVHRGKRTTSVMADLRGGQPQLWVSSVTALISSRVSVGCETSSPFFPTHERWVM